MKIQILRSSEYEKSIAEMDEAVHRFEQLSPLQRRIALRKYSKHPPRLYKYRGMRTNQQIDERARGYLKDIIVGNNLWLSRCSDFNDPFEGSVAYEIPAGDVERRDALTRLMIRNGKNARDARSLISSAVIHDDARIRGIGDRAQAELISKLGVCCFCATPRNPISWAHYADEHRGVCLQFDVATDVAAFTSLQIEYNDNFPTASVFDDSNQNVLCPFLRKSEDWTYEKEWRKFKTGQARAPMPFRPKALTGLFFGCRCPDEDREFVLDLIDQRVASGYPRPGLFNVTKAPRRYRFNVWRAQPRDKAPSYATS